MDFYLRRLSISLVITMSFILYFAFTGYYDLIFSFEKNMEEFICFVDFSGLQTQRNLKVLCKLPVNLTQCACKRASETFFQTAGDIWMLLLSCQILIFLNAAVIIKRLFEFFVFPDTETLGANFLREIIDDPLAVIQNSFIGLRRLKIF